jgi:beta-lactamase superfamily II metal-dependent hydrolase
MDYEVDFLAVGEESKCGDAIALRYGNLDGPRDEQTVIVIDGGFRASGETLVQHINSRYDTNRVDMVLATHADQDHVSGLEVVLEEMDVGQLLMHQPWRHSTGITEARAHGFETLAASRRLQESLREASDLEQIANDNDIPIVEPFAGRGTNDGIFRILGPSKLYYEELLPDILGPPSTRAVAKSLLEAAVERARAAQVRETLEHETLRDDGVTKPSNNTSVISLLTIDGQELLFTGDAGIPALEDALDLLEADGFQPGDLRFVQVPHHGSRRNVGPSVLDRLLGEKGQTECHSTAFLSAAKKNPEGKHPGKKVLNAFKRRGYAVHVTEGQARWHYSSNVPERSDYSPSTPAPFHEYVEEDSDSQ